MDQSHSREVPGGTCRHQSIISGPSMKAEVQIGISAGSSCSAFLRQHCSREKAVKGGGERYLKLMKGSLCLGQRKPSYLISQTSIIHHFRLIPERFSNGFQLITSKAYINLLLDTVSASDAFCH